MMKISANLTSTLRIFMKVYCIDMIEQIYYSFTDHYNHCFLLHLPCYVFSLSCLMHTENTIQNMLLSHLLKWHCIKFVIQRKKVLTYSSTHQDSLTAKWKPVCIYSSTLISWQTGAWTSLTVSITSISSTSPPHRPYRFISFYQQSLFIYLQVPLLHSFKTL